MAPEPRQRRRRYPSISMPTRSPVSEEVSGVTAKRFGFEPSEMTICVSHWGQTSDRKLLSQQYFDMFCTSLPKVHRKDRSNFFMPPGNAVARGSSNKLTGDDEDAVTI